MTDSARPLCDCPEPCACYAEGYAAGKDKAYFEVLASLDGPPHAGECACQPCQVKRACLQKVMTLMARSSPALLNCWRSGRWTAITTETAHELILTRQERMIDARRHLPDGRCTRAVAQETGGPLRKPVVECGHIGT